MLSLSQPQPHRGAVYCSENVSSCIKTLGVGRAGVPGLRGGARLGGEDCGVGGGRPRREEIEHKHGSSLWSWIVLKVRPQEKEVF